MVHAAHSNRLLGLVIALFGLAILFIWVPLDTDTGIIEKVRRQVTIGDALAPSIAAAFLIVGGLLLAAFDRSAPEQAPISRSKFRFITTIILIAAVSLIVMRYAGPLIVALTNMVSQSSLEYRLLRDTAPWKYIGYLGGGVTLLAGIIALVEGRLTVRIMAIALTAVVLLAAIYDLPFDDLLLPPNGDV